ncbi:dihydropteroate synthase [Parasphingopyxis marina]|uniref:dihydropteroate synthase n=1 Tax=Parasphingopyxis marina TaxID=2761622 RepID=A0A842I278_9SPHN|nr:dihydropteroate synthase [Parasphingopyxis marina]MBC2778360.1 dihydropteroate synthase [Parasphingopyxis marina]
MTDIPPSAELYFRPTAFVDAPFGLDDQVKRLAGGLLWFSAFEVIVVDGGKRVSAPLVPITELEGFLAGLGEGQAQAAAQTITRIEAPRAPFTLGQRTLRFDEPIVAAILNCTPDSFSDGGKHDSDPQAAADAGFAMASDGAALIDVGGESTRPGSADVWEGDEIERVVPVIEKLAASGIAVSIDTRKASVMEAALAAGATIVNDVSGLRFDDRAVEAVAKAGCPVIVMHHPGKRDELHKNEEYSDPLVEVYDWLKDRVDALVEAGIAREKIVVDPGIGFGKKVQHNLAVLNGLSLFHGIGCPIMLGASRKRLIGALSNEASADERLGGSLALVTQGAAQGVQLLRVHDVFESIQALRIWRGLRDAALAPLV